MGDTQTRPSTRQLIARMREANRAACDAARAYEATLRECQQAQDALTARLAEPAEPRVSAWDLAAQQFTGGTCWAANRATGKPWVHAGAPGGTTVCGKTAGPPAPTAATCPACLGIPWPKRR